MKKILKGILFILLAVFMSFQYLKVESSDASAGSEVQIGSSNIAYWNGGMFYEYMSKEYVSENDSNDTVTYLIRYGIHHEGSWYTYQVTPVRLRVDGVHIATYSDYIKVHIARGNYTLGASYVTLKKGVNHNLTLEDDGGTMTSINVSGNVFHALPTYTVNFVDGFGNRLSSQSVTKYQNAYPPSVSRSGYTFAGWSGSYRGVTSSRTITATWSPNTYYVSYDANGGTNAPPTTAFSYNTGAHISSQKPTRNGYTFMGWEYAGYNFNPGQAIPSGWGSFRLTAKWNKAPTIKGDSFYLIEGDSFSSNQLISGVGGYYKSGTDKAYPDKLVKGTFPVTANDAEDGNLTGKISVSSIVHEDGSKHREINTNKPGKYTINYSVTDNTGGVGAYARTITVLPKSTPNITAKDRYFYKETKITSEMLMEKVNASDKYDGNITSNVKIISNNIDSSKIGKYEVKYQIVNRSNVTSTAIANINIVNTILEEEDSEAIIRYIEPEHLDSLKPTSKWIYDASLTEQIIKSAETGEAVQEYTFENNDVKEVKRFVKDKDYGKDIEGKVYNNLFSSVFERCKHK